MIPQDFDKHLAELEQKAWKALAGYKFWMFGYYAAQWVFLNKLDGTKPRINPFGELVRMAREKFNGKRKLSR
jgi:hypothetical protein